MSDDEMIEMIRDGIVEEVNQQRGLLGTPEIIEFLLLDEDIRKPLLQSEFAEEFNKAMDFKGNRQNIDLSDRAKRAATQEIKKFYGIPASAGTHLAAVK